MSEQGQSNNASVQANDNSNAVGSISAGGDISGNIHIENVVGYTPDEVSKLLSQISSTFQVRVFDGKCPHNELNVVSC
jgi:hypothetical protein